MGQRPRRLIDAPTGPRLAVYGLVLSEDVEPIRCLQRQWARETRDDRALRFPVHLTIRGPFISRIRDEVEAAERVIACLPRQVPEARLPLLPLAWIAPSLLWLEAAPSHGREELTRLHHVLHTRLDDDIVVFDHVLPEHAGAGYRPHITICWAASAQSLSLPTAASRPPPAVRVGRIAVVAYPSEWPEAGRVKVLRSVPTA